MKARALGAVTAGSALIFAIVSSAASPPAVAAPAPKIVVVPDSVMVNTQMKVTGRNFPANTKVTIEECSRTFWVVPQNPCATANVLRVITNSKGHFSHTMIAEVCPGGTTKSPGFSETCYVGEPVPKGIDTVALLGAAQITVTGP
jgi:hypothetical protein